MVYRIFCLVVLLVVAATAARANPEPDFAGLSISTSYWFIKTAPINYAADLAAFAFALWITGQAAVFAWKLLPVYNIIVFTAGYTADFLAKAITSYPAFNITSREPIIGKMILDDITKPTMWESFRYMTLAAILIFLFNLGIIYLVLRWNEADTFDRVPVAAAAVAFLTAPYLSLKGNPVGPLPWLAPAMLGCVVVAVYLGLTRRAGIKRHIMPGKT